MHFIITPNPFTHSVKIVLQTQAKERLNIKVYDVSGRLVKNLYEGVINGNHMLNWHGDDDLGCKVPAGVYFVHLESGTMNKPISQKVIKLE